MKNDVINGVSCCNGWRHSIKSDVISCYILDRLVRLVTAQYAWTTWSCMVLWYFADICLCCEIVPGTVWFEQNRECSVWNVALKELRSRLLEGLIAFRLRKLQTGFLVLPVLST